ncbi:Aste57867_21177 [Aphanomyces stellatus]|uniref:Aste57867_21177 protein n=1 Tax=Aphanomyces stellatus TaxID=120398 RepID=A0A485LLI4_9STRA|nr:hypothetical protein As57867_021109 [Aphanomyces stellatus]VFT97851.1 Aste57867_21177 [Aphanomyces stellatus]
MWAHSQTEGPAFRTSIPWPLHVPFDWLKIDQSDVAIPTRSGSVSLTSTLVVDPAAMSSTSLFTLEDAKASFNLFCCVYGIGTLGMPGNFARAGPLWGLVALLFMALVNVYASVVCSKVLLKAPSSVQTFADLGAWALGPRGRVAVVLSQMGVCLFVPCAFLVLGGTLLDVIIPAAFPPPVWSILMAISILPVTLVPTLKEGAGAALAGCVGTILADFIALGILVHYLHGSASSTHVPSPAISFHSLASTFGNLSLAYGAAIVIPDLQRQHAHPERMPRVVLVTMLLVSVLFVAIATTGYAMVGCQIPGNLLFAVSGTALGFTAARGAVVLAFMMMQLHITIGFSVILHPSFYYAERWVLGVHAAPDDSAKTTSRFQVLAEGDDDDDGDDHEAANGKPLCENDDASNVADPDTPTATDSAVTTHSSSSTGGSSSSNPKFIQCCVLRVAIVTFLTIVSVLLHDHFHELVDLIGASSVSLSCIILPIACYLQVCADDIGAIERIFCCVTIVVCGVLSLYVTVESAAAMVAPPAADTGIVFPFCPAPYQVFSYTNASHYATTTTAINPR